MTGTRYSQETVAIVVDPDFGDRLNSIAERMPVWVADTPGNAAAIKRLFRELRRTGEGSVTSFIVDKKAHPTSVLPATIESVNLHHGMYSQDPPYRQIKVYGVWPGDLTNNVLEELRQIGPYTLRGTPFGFRIAFEGGG